MCWRGIFNVLKERDKNKFQMAKTIKKDGTYDNRKNDGGRPAKGKVLHEKKTAKQMEKALKPKNKPGKKI